MKILLRVLLGLVIIGWGVLVINYGVHLMASGSFFTVYFSVTALGVVFIVAGVLLMLGAKVKDTISLFMQNH